jgi:3-isopropylmalate/(R)-2-methylmalate dehydratase small subunit
MSRLTRVTGRALPLRGHDIDTDRIIPARFLRAVSFEGLERYVFADDRAGGAHPFDDPRYAGAAVLLVNRNFGCGSSREHAPQALQRWGIQAVVGEGYSEIFFGNAVQLGLPCVTVAPDDIEQLMRAVEQNPGTTLTVDLEAMAVAGASFHVAAQMPQSARDALTSGLWDGTGMLLEDFDAVRAVAARLPYTGEWTGHQPGLKAKG